MGKGEIIDELGDGQYTVRIKYAGRDRVAQQISDIDEILSQLAEQISNLQAEIEDLLLALEPLFDPEKTDPEIDLAPITEDPGIIETDPTADDPSVDPPKRTKDPQPDDTGDPQPDDEGDPGPIDESDPDPLLGSASISGTITDS